VVIVIWDRPGTGTGVGVLAWGGRRGGDYLVTLQEERYTQYSTRDGEARRRSFFATHPSLGRCRQRLLSQDQGLMILHSFRAGTRQP
jgi:hypothetical protein